MALPLFSGQIHITTFVNDYKTCLGLALSLSIFKKQPTLHIPQTFKEVPKKYNLSISYLKSNLKKNQPKKVFVQQDAHAFHIRNDSILYKK